MSKKNQETIMDSQHKQQEKWEKQRAHANRVELAELIARAIREDGKIEPIKGMILQRASSPGEPLHIVADPSFCVIAQGSKEIILSDESYMYDPAHYLLVTTELPLTGHIRDASQEQPYLSFRLVLDTALVNSVMVEAGDVTPENYADVRAITVSPLGASLLDAVVRLVRLVDTPEASFLAPLITREIVFRLWMGEQRERLRHIAANGGYTSPIAKAIERLRTKFDQPLRIEEIARESGMSVSGFHHHFKVVTAMSPLQFQKQLRLQEARRLMLGERLDAASAGFRVGYDDASHFSREYKRHFGLPPLRDVERLRQNATG
jgi:AraC-like DNA-binding protein